MFLGVPVLLYIGAAAWRMSNMISHKEKGPFQIIWKLHLWVRRLARKYAWVKKSEVLEGMECEYCNSIWFGSLFTAGYLLLGDRFLYLLLPLAVSTVAIIIKHIVFMVKSIDTRFDQQNQNELAARQEKAEAKKVIAVRQPVGDALYETSLEKGGSNHG